MSEMKVKGRGPNLVMTRGFSEERIFKLEQEVGSIWVTQLGKLNRKKRKKVVWWRAWWAQALRERGQHMQGPCGRKEKVRA